MNMRFPQDVSVLGWGDSELSEAWNMCAITQPIEEIAVAAAELLLDIIEGRKERGSMDMVFETQLIHRSSCAMCRSDS